MCPGQSPPLYFSISLFLIFSSLRTDHKAQYKRGMHTCNRPQSRFHGTEVRASLYSLLDTYLDPLIVLAVCSHDGATDVTHAARRAVALLSIAHHLPPSPSPSSPVASPGVLTYSKFCLVAKVAAAGSRAWRTAHTTLVYIARSVQKGPFRVSTLRADDRRCCLGVGSMVTW